MKNQNRFKKRYGWITIVTILISIIIWAAYGLFAEEEHMEKVHISVIVEDSGNSRWNAFQQGLERAAKDFQVDLSIVTTAYFSGSEEQWELAEQKIEDGTDGILLAPYSADGIGYYLKDLKGKSRILLVESDVRRSKDTVMSVSYVGPDYGDMGKALFDEIIKDYENRPKEDTETDLPADEENSFNTVLQGKKILLLTSNPVKLGIIQAEEKIKELMEAQDIAVLETDIVSQGDDNSVFGGKQADIVIALDDVSLQIAAKELASRTENHSKLYGIGIGADNVYYLERGIICSMLVVNDFKMGYEGLSLLANTIRTNNSEQQRVDIGFQAVRPEEVHIPAMEKLLFPLVQ